MDEQLSGAQHTLNGHVPFAGANRVLEFIDAIEAAVAYDEASPTQYGANSSSAYDATAPTSSAASHAAGSIENALLVRDAYANALSIENIAALDALFDSFGHGCHENWAAIKQNVHARCAELEGHRGKDAADSDQGERVELDEAAMERKAEDASFEQCSFSMSASDSDVSGFAQVAGLESLQLELFEAFVFPRLRPDLFQPTTNASMKQSHSSRARHRSVLLHGPPGCGKTFIARALAGEIHRLTAGTGTRPVTFLPISPAMLLSKWTGESEKAVRAVFRVARSLAPCVLFVDEIDALGISRDDMQHGDTTSRRLLAEFLLQSESLQAADDVVLVAATNCALSLDAALLRRFDCMHHVPLPCAITRRQLLCRYLDGTAHSLRSDEIDEIARTEFNEMSANDIKLVCHDAVARPLRALVEQTFRDSRRALHDFGRDHQEWSFGQGSASRAAAATASSSSAAAAMPLISVSRSHFADALAAFARRNELILLDARKRLDAHATSDHSSDRELAAAASSSSSTESDVESTGSGMCSTNQTPEMKYGDANESDYPDTMNTVND
jgi:ATP-dependent 26S proteasome regulatory subunit